MYHPKDTTRTRLVNARDWEPFMKMTEAQQDDWLLEQMLMSAPDPVEPEPDDYRPTGDEIAENAGPTLVEITEYVGDGDEAEEATWTVVAGVNSPAFGLVA